MHKQALSINLAMIPPSWLGDTVIYMAIAQNLAQNGYKVTYFSSLLAPLNHWFPAFMVKSLPPENELENVLNKFHIALVDRATLHGFYNLDLDKVAELSKKYIISAAHVLPSILRHDHTPQITAKYPSEIAKKICLLADGNSEITFTPNKDLTVLDHALIYCKEKLHLDEIGGSITTKPPNHLIQKKHDKRIVLCPYSSDPKKDWSISRFAKLARLLAAKGYQPIFSVLPSDIDKLPPAIRNCYEVPITNSLEELVILIYESAALIAVDTGSGHLASLVGIPTVTIYRKQRNKFRWRPAWGNNQVVRPKLQLKFNRTRLWSPFISVHRVLKEMQTII